MRVKFGKFEIAGFGDADMAGGLPSSPGGIDWDGQRAVQVDEFVRGEYPEFRDRGQRVTNLSFSVERIHESYGAAQLFCLTHERELPVVDRLIMVGSLGEGREVQRICERAALTSVRVGSSRVDLQACKLEYSIVSPK